jgi:hypothetical protein
MSASSSSSAPPRKDGFDDAVSGAQDRPWIPRLRSDEDTVPRAHSLRDFRTLEGSDAREAHLRELWARLPSAASRLPGRPPPGAEADGDGLSSQRAQELGRQYEDELAGRCHGHARATIRWPEFRAYADAKEAGVCGPPRAAATRGLTARKSCGRSSTTSSTWTGTGTSTPRSCRRRYSVQVRASGATL